MKKQFGFLILITLLSAGCGTQSTSSNILVTFYIEMEESVHKQLVHQTNLSEVAFISRSEQPISISVPIGDEEGCSATFRIQVKESSVTISNVFVAAGGRMDRDIFPDDENSAYIGPYQLTTGSFANGVLSDPIEIARWAYARNRREKRFSVVVVVETFESMPVPKTHNVHEYQGKLYHQLQNVDPRFMRYGKPSN